jgi:hypothetical protein
LHAAALCSLLVLFAGNARAQELMVSTVATGFSSSLGGIAVDASGNLYVSDTDNYVVRKISPTGVVSLLAGQVGVTGSADGPASKALFASPSGIAVDGAGNVFVADTYNNTIRKISPAGAVSTLAGTPGPGNDQDGVGTGAGFNEPTGLAIDASGNLFVADLGGAAIREVTPNGTVATLIGLRPPNDYPTGIAVDTSGNIVVSNTAAVASATFLPLVSNVIQVRAFTGVLSTIAGQSGLSGNTDGPGASALFNLPSGLGLDRSGNVFVADSGNNAIRMITPAGQVITVAGGASAGFADGAGVNARLTWPTALAVDASGTVFIADGGGAIRRGIPVSHTQSPTRLVNISSRGNVAAGAPLIAGFVVEGSVGQTVLVRAVGPGLKQFGVTGTLADPRLDIFGQGGVHLASSTDGISTTDAQSAAALVGAFPLVANSGDAPLVISLAPGAYTAQASSLSGSSGGVLLEVYEVP